MTFADLGNWWWLIALLLAVLGAVVCGVIFARARRKKPTESQRQLPVETPPQVQQRTQSPYLQARARRETEKLAAGDEDEPESSATGQDNESAASLEQSVEQAGPEPTAQQTASETAPERVSSPPPPPAVEPTPAAEKPEIEEGFSGSESGYEVPESAAGRMVRLRSRLAKSGSFGKLLLGVFSSEQLSAEDWEDIEDTLIMADLGVEATEELMEELRVRSQVLGGADEAEIKQVLAAKLLELVQPDLDRSLRVEGEDGKPAVVLTVGVNGTGKTTTVGKLARLLRAEDKSVLLGAADTFRAAAAEQLTTWGERVGVPVVSSDQEGADPASVAFEAVRVGIEQQRDVVIIDTAGRLQNKSDLMAELGKIARVAAKNAPITETLLVLDASTGQNGMQQAKIFASVVPVSGIVLTKLDGTAKGGIVVSVQRELGVPVKLVGLGEGPDDLVPFNPEDFVQALLS